jgi:hypothetical protein
MTNTCRVICVGEMNPYGASPEFALYDSPPNCAGHRLRRILGLSSDHYLALHRTNLCIGDWSKDQAKQRVRELLSPDAPWRVIVLLGRKVTEAFEKVALDAPLIPFTSRACCPGMTLVSLPHPSGRNASSWNPKLQERARQMLRELAPEVPWGLAVAAQKACA